MQVIVMSYRDFVKQTPYAAYMQMTKKELLSIGLINDMFNYTDPNYIKIKRGEKIAFFELKINGVQYAVLRNNQSATRHTAVLRNFFSGELEQKFTNQIPQTWDYFNNTKNAIAYRGGKGYHYAIWQTIEN